MASAAFHFDAQASLLKKSATPSGTVTLTLDSTDGVRTVLWEVSLTCENSAAAWTITGSTSDGATLNVPAGSDKACIVRCTVNGGTPTGTEDALDLVKTAKVYIGSEVLVAGEETESNATYGWGPIVNAVITGGGGVSLSNTAPSNTGTASAGVGADASRFDHVHDHGTHLGGTLHASASGAAAGFMSAAHYTTVNSAAEAPTVSVIPIRTSAGNLRCVGASCETATDASRYVRGTGADGTTLAAMRVEGSSVVLGGKNADATNKLTCTQAADGSALTLAVTSSAAASNPLTVASTALKLLGTSQKCADASDAYGQTYTPAAAATLVYGNDLTSLTDRITQASAGAGKTRNIFGGLGAAGSANGAFYFGLENGNTVTGGSVNACLGSLVANVSDPFIFGVGTPGSLTTILDVFQLSAGQTRIRSLTNALNIFTGGALSLSSNVDVSISSAADITVSADVWYRKSVAGAYIYREPVGSFGPIASATTTTVFSYTTVTARIYDVVATVVVTNDTDNEGATYYLRASFKNIAGTVTQIGATQTIAADLEDAGQTGLSCTLDFSGTALRVRLTTDAVDTVNGSYVVKITERVQA